jgi:hypothetical protein
MDAMQSSRERTNHGLNWTAQQRRFEVLVALGADPRVFVKNQVRPFLVHESPAASGR